MENMIFDWQDKGLTNKFYSVGVMITHRPTHYVETVKKETTRKRMRKRRETSIAHVA